jgi:hypothetical protein
MYRILPKKVFYPKRYPTLSGDDFNKLEKQQVSLAPLLCEGHGGTTVWHTKQGYIVQVKLNAKPDVNSVTPCTYTPTFGVDTVDAMYIQDAEEYILAKELGRPTNRLLVFMNEDYVNAHEYFAAHGLDNLAELTKEKISFIKYLKKKLHLFLRKLDLIQKFKCKVS